jgi:hypothetical protein
VLTLVIGVVAVALAWKALPADDSRRLASGRMDWACAGLIAVTVAGIDLFLGNGGHLGWSSPFVLGCIVAATVAFVAFVVIEKRSAEPLVHIDDLRSRYAWPLIVVTILCFASFMVVLSFIIPSIAEDRPVGFNASGVTTALLFITRAALVQLIVAPLIGRLAVRIGFVTVLRAGIVGAVAVVALLAVFVLDRNMAVLLMIGFGAAMGVTLTPLAALGVIQAPEDEPGSLPGICNAAFGIGGSLGFTWAGTIVGEGPAIVDGLRCGRSYLARSCDVALELTASCPSGDGVAGPGQTLRVPSDGRVTVTAVISGAAGTDVALITAEGRVRRATVGSDRARVQWELDAASVCFARLEIREAHRRPLGAMVAMTNPIWLG